MLAFQRFSKSVILRSKVSMMFSVVIIWEKLTCVDIGLSDGIKGKHAL